MTLLFSWVSIRMWDIFDLAKSMIRLQDVVDCTVACDAVDGSVRGVCLPGPLLDHSVAWVSADDEGEGGMDHAVFF